ncbi:MAG TPA: Hsp70 family protein, partial [Polyangiaceae bacterium]|nr:Hsp70 family protein [Polyangiaceae bacterium]
QVPLTDLDPDLVVAYGAAISAAALSGQGEDVLLLDVLPLSLGVETMGGGVDKILPRNLSIPAGARSTFTTYADNQTGFEVHVVQGERELAQDCRSLARFKITGIPPMPAGMARLEIEFQVDENNLLHVSARETTTGIEQSIDVTPSYGLSEDEIEQMLIDALDHGEQDLEARRVADARVEAERVLLATEKSLRDDASLLDPSELARINTAIADLHAVIERTRLSADVKATHINSRLDELDDATKAWAGRRMNQAIARALGGQQLEQVAHSVEAARGVDAHVHEHEQNRSGRRI